MAKNKTGLIIGLVVAGVAGYLLLNKKTISTAPTTVTPPAGSLPASSSTSASTSLLTSLVNLGQTLFGSSSSANNMTFAPVGTATVTSTAQPSPAGDVSYINPSSAPQLSITAPTDVVSTDNTSPDLTDIFL